MDELADHRGSTLARWWGLLTLAGRRVVSQGTGDDSRQVWLTVFGIALPVALMLLVTSVSLGLATETTVRNPDIDYRIVPESAGASSAVVSVGGPQFGRTHAVSQRLTARSDITYATPLLMQLLRVNTTSGTTVEYVLAVGVIPREKPETFAGASTAALTPGDPHFANGSYDGPWTGEAVLSSGAAAILNASPGTTLVVSGQPNTRFTVVNVTGSESAGLTQFPVMLVHLSELQTITGAAGGDQADQILVKTTDPGVKPTLEAVYPRSLVLTQRGLTTRSVLNSKLPLAISVSAFIVAIVVGVLFAASTMGLAIAAESRHRAIMAAIGMSARSRTFLVVVQAVVTALLGGALGVLLGLGGLVLVNTVVERVWLDLSVARFHPGLIVYGIAVAVLIAGLATPYLVYMSRRTTTIRDLQN